MQGNDPELMEHLARWPPPLSPPLQGNDPELMEHLARWLSDESKDNCGVELDTSDWPREFPRQGVPQQYNAVDCGAFTIM